MIIRFLSQRKHLFISLGTFLLGALILFGVQKVLADNTMYYACVKTSNGSIRIVNASTTCGSGETLISWNQTGPQGAQGIQGPAGGGGNGFITPLTNVNFHNYDFRYRDMENTDFSNSD